MSLLIIKYSWRFYRDNYCLADNFECFCGLFFKWKYISWGKAESSTKEHCNFLAWLPLKRNATQHLKYLFVWFIFFFILVFNIKLKGSVLFYSKYNSVAVAPTFWNFSPHFRYQDTKERNFGCGGREPRFSSA